jgi:predicted NBD/HSP70 family sugar kinase
VCGDVPVSVTNDGDVSALAGYMTLGSGRVLGAAFGTSFAVGYVDAAGGFLGWEAGDEFVGFSNELAFVIADLDPAAARDVNWSDKPCYSQFLSQDAVVRLGRVAGIAYDSGDLAEQLKEVQALAEAGDERAASVFRSVGAYLAHGVPHFAWIYGGEIASILLLGRVMSGVGGEIILATARQILAEEYPAVAVALVLPDEEFRRKGQAVYASFIHA